MIESVNLRFKQKNLSSAAMLYDFRKESDMTITSRVQKQSLVACADLSMSNYTRIATRVRSKGGWGGACPLSKYSRPPSKV